MSDIFIHPTAEVSSSAKIGKGTKIWNNAQVREYVQIGENCIVSKDVYIDKNVVIGSRVKIQNGANLYDGVTIEDDVFLGPSMTFTNDMYPRAFNSDWTITDTRVKRGASVGAGAIIRCGITIGEYAMIGAGSVVTKDVKPHSLVIGNPARHSAWICRCGCKISESMSCSNCNSSYYLKDGEIKPYD